MPLLPDRRTLRSRWSTLAWAGGICVLAVSIVPRGGTVGIDAATADGSAAAQNGALAAEDD